MHLQQGMSFHHFTIQRFCGEGAFGEVYLAADMTGRKLALKIVAKSKIGDAWKRELRGLVHYCRIAGGFEYLLNIWHIDEDSTSFYYTMEPADNISADPEVYEPDTLANRIKKAPLDPMSLFVLAEQLLQGLKSIHDMDMVHRDIKPSNILFVNGQPKLADIGLVCSEQSVMTHFAGTMEFIPPEIKKMPPSSSGNGYGGKKNDIYAFGMVLYCALTGNTPDKFPSLPEKLEQTSPVKQLNHLICRACSSDPFKRIRDVNEFLFFLKNAERKAALPCEWKEKLLLFLDEVRLSLKARTEQIKELLGRHPFFASVLFLCLIGLSFFAGYSLRPPSEIQTVVLPLKKITNPVPPPAVPGKPLSSLAASYAERLRRGRIISKIQSEISAIHSDMFKEQRPKSATENLVVTLPYPWLEYRKKSCPELPVLGAMSQEYFIPKGGRTVFLRGNDSYLEICFYKKSDIKWNSDASWKRFIRSLYAEWNIPEALIRISRHSSSGGLETVFCELPDAEENPFTTMAFQRFGDEIVLYRFRALRQNPFWAESDFKKILNSSKKN